MDRVKLGEIAILINGDRGKNYPSQSDISAEGDIPFVNAGHLNGRSVDFSEMNYISKDKYDKLNSGKFVQGDILYCLRGSLGKKAIVSDNIVGAIASSLVIIRPDNNVINGQYLMFSLDARSIKEQLEKANNGSSQPNLSAASVRDYRIELPSLSIQTEIVNKLSKARYLIDRRTHELELLDDLIKARFVELFGNKGENPNGYEEDTLGNLYKFQYGKGNNIPEDKGEYPCYGSNGQVGHHTEYNSEDAPIIGHIGAYAGIVNWGAGKHYVTYNGVICNLKTDRINPVYGFHLLQQQDFNRVATKGGGQPFVSYSDLESPIVVIPPIEVQKDYAEFAKQVDKSKFVVQKSLDEAKLLFDSLMQEYFA